MKKKWLALSLVVAFFAAAFVALWLERPALDQGIRNTISESVANKLNGSFSYNELEISLAGTVTLTDPVVRDTKGDTVLSGTALTLDIYPWKALTALASSDGTVASAIGTIHVDNPDLYIVQVDDNTWNVTNLVKSSRQRSDAGYRGAIQFQSGTIHATFKDGTTATGEDTHGSVDLAKYPVMAIAGTTVIDGHEATVSGTYTSARQFTFTVQTDAVDITYASPFIPASTDVVLRSGRVEHVKARISQSPQGLTVSGQADVVDGSLTAQGYDVADVNGHADITTDDVRIEDAVASINGQHVEASGLINISGDTPVFDMAIDAPSVDLTALTDQLPVSGTAGFTGKAWGTMQNLSIDGDVTIGALDYEGLTLSNGAAHVVYHQDDVTIDSLGVDVAGGHIDGSGKGSVKSGDFSGTASFDGITLEMIPQIPVSVTGVVSGTASAYGNAKNDQITAQAHVEGQGLSYMGATIDTAVADVDYADGLAVVHSLDASVAGGTLQASGTFDTKNNVPDITFTAAAIPLDIASPWLSIPVSGTVSAAGHVWGSPMQWNLAFNAANGVIKGMPYDSIDGSLHGTGNHIEIPSVTWRYVDGVHEAHGMADLDSRALDLTVTTTRMRLERLLPALGKGDLAMTGWADNVVTVTGTLDNPAASGTFHLTDGSYSGYLYKNISADYTLRDGRLYLSQGDISSYTASIAFDGSVGDTLDLNISGKDIDISRIAPGKGHKRSGLVNLNAHIGGTLDNPTASGSLRGPSLVIADMLLTDVRGDFNYYDGIVRLTDLHIGQGGGDYKGSLIYNTADSRIVGRGSVEKGNIESLIRLSGAPLQKITGTVDGTVAVNGTSDAPDATFTGQLTAASIDGQPLDPADIDIRFHDQTFYINKLTLAMGDSLLAAEGTYSLHGPVNLQAAARKFPGKVLLDILGKDGSLLDAPIDFAAQLSGNGDDPDANISITLSSGTMNGVTFTEAYAMANIKDSIIHLNQAYVSKEPYKASASGTIPVSALKGGRTAESMDVTLKLDNAGLDILTFLTPYIKSAEGGIVGSLKVSGTLAEPLLNGTLSVDDGSIQIKEVDYPLSHIKGTIAFQGNRVTAQASAQMDKDKAKKPGNVTLEGHAAWNGWTLTDYSGDVDLDRLNVDCPYFQGPLTGHLEFAPGEHSPKLSGIVTLSDTTLAVPLTMSSSSEMPDVELDFVLSAGKNVHLYQPALYDMYIDGSVHFQGTADHPRPSGRFVAQKGRVYYLDTRFNLSKAQADFSVSDSFLPNLMFEGQSRVGQYTVLLTLRGPVDNLDLMLRSDPPLTKQQIVSLITLRNGGKIDSSIDSKDVNALVGAGIRMTLNSLGVTQELERALDLDMLTISSGSLDFNDKNTDINRNYYNIEMGKYLFNDFMLTAAFGLNHGDNRFGFSYDLNKRLKLGGYRSTNSTVGGIQYRYNF